MSVSQMRHGGRTRAARRAGQARGARGESQLSLGGLLAPARPAPSSMPERPRRPAPAATLDDVLGVACAALTAHHAIACPVCDGTMVPVAGDGGAVAGRCSNCGSRLA